jgi:hypothetical protein
VPDHAGERITHSPVVTLACLHGATSPHGTAMLLQSARKGCGKAAEPAERTSGAKARSDFQGLSGAAKSRAFQPSVQPEFFRNL